MTESKLNVASIERRSLEVGKWSNVVMGVSGVTAAYLSHSDALLVDGVYSGVNFVSAIVAAKVSASILKPADRRYPFGYAAYEALYVKFRSMVLLGIVTFAVFGAVQKIVTYATGGDVPELVFGPILIYSVAMVAICGGLAAWHHHNWKRAGKQSELLKAESKAAIVDGVISAGVGGGLLVASLLRGTALEFIVPVADSIVVLVMAAVIVRQPLLMFIGSCREVAGAATDAETIDKVRERMTAFLQDQPYTVVEVAATKLGRSYFVVPYLRPDASVDASEVDRLREQLQAQCAQLLGNAAVEVIITAVPPYEEAPNAIPEREETDDQPDG